MVTDILTSASLQSMARSLSINDLIRTTDTLRQSGQSRSADTLYATWIAHNAEHPLLYAILFNYAVVLTEAGRHEDAREHLERALALNADFLPAYINLGRVYEQLGKIGPALVQWSVALTKTSALTGQTITYKTTALNQSGRTLEAAQQDAAAEAMLRQSLELDPRQREVVQHYLALRQRQCEWPVVQAWDRVTELDLRLGMSPLSAAAYSDDPLFHLALASHYQQQDVGFPAHPLVDWPQARVSTGRLRLGYLSSDFREHAIGYLMAEVLALHDRSRVEIFAYDCGPASNDPLRQHFRATADHWVCLNGLDDFAAAQRIAADGIQVLIDVNGYTRDARLKLLSHRPAPVLVNWLGYPGTTGSPHHHYILADDWIIPPDHELFYSEKVLRVPCYQPNNRNREVAHPLPSRASAGLPATGFVFCCFNGLHKLTRFTFERWLLILASVPDSILWLLSSTPEAEANLRAHAAAKGLDPQRLIFAPKLANPHHLARYPLADLFLDTTPYGAHTTASDALWMGVPVLTWSGRSFASRVCGSLVRSAGVPELVCQSAEEYVARAVEFGRNPTLLQPLREKLADAKQHCALFDTPGLVRSLEERCLEAWRAFETDQLPQPDLRNLETYLEVGAQIRPDELEVQSIDSYLPWWRERLLRRHRLRALGADERLVPTFPAPSVSRIH